MFSICMLICTLHANTSTYAHGEVGVHAIVLLYKAHIVVDHREERIKRAQSCEVHHVFECDLCVRQALADQSFRAHVVDEYVSTLPLHTHCWRQSILCTFIFAALLQAQHTSKINSAHRCRCARHRLVFRRCRLNLIERNIAQTCQILCEEHLSAHDLREKEDI